MAATRTTRSRTYRDEESGWTGWIAFAAIMLILVGMISVIEGLTAIFNPHYYIVAPSGLLVTGDLTVWGWVQFSMGVIGLLTGFGVFMGNLVARVVAAIIAGVSAIVHLAFIPAYPFWSIIIILLDIIVIYAITAHGDEFRTPSKNDDY